MAKSKGQNIETLLKQEAWKEARAQIQRELKEQPSNHWLVTQLGVTYYEEENYQQALLQFGKSLEIKRDCPLTLWNTAGALDALAHPDMAIRFYTFLLRSDKTATDDPCWESKQWADSLKTDCVYRIGLCWLHLKRWEPAEHCFWQYFRLVSWGGMNGTYSMDDVARHIKELKGKRQKPMDDVMHDAFRMTLLAIGKLAPKDDPEELVKQLHMELQTN